ncbi:sigma-70 family RNA polymerase sigma factor [Rhizobacter sp. AJA081-3]|uniref:RNA polymerase sigma factor n=1 Tax=Rhizobacter sp. AJA081-3 TaxID=2753607 RepID=UPI001AE0BDA2|nr:sigma-70 family RNA polymerase sigma factor [Rhizobacter sp. AJA081-3]QTN22194.1 sigma-70 family RNA polymerase sigma factor [Rhizobacter sp. AJA081-3]
MDKHIDDEEYLRGLLRRIGQSDERALGELMPKFNVIIARFAWNKLRSEEDAEEVVVDTFEAVWKSAKSFEGRSTVSTWIFGIAERRVLMKLRSRRRHEDQVDIDEVTEPLVSEYMGPAEIVLAKERDDFFKDCVSKLTTAHRDCLMLQLEVGLTDAQIAEVIAISLGTIKTRLHHAKLNVTRCVRRKLGLSDKP